MTARPLPPWPNLHADLADKPMARTAEDFAVGVVAFRYDDTYRTYRTDERGRSIGNAIERYHWIPTLITGENKASWIGGTYRDTTKSPKRPTPDRPARLLGLDEVEDALWLSVHAYKVGGVVRMVENAATLRQIAELVGYKPEEWE